mgnify:CR=1 FL=1
MSLHLAILRNQYRDSVALMQLSAALARLDGIAQASAVMATPANLALLSRAGLLDTPPEAAPNDLLIALEGEEAAFDAALTHTRQALEAPTAYGVMGMRERARQLGGQLSITSEPGQGSCLQLLIPLELS